MRTKNDLAFIATTYFLSSGYSPTRPVSPDDAHRFAENVYWILVGVGSDPNWKQRLYNLIVSFCNYHGINIRHAAQWLNKNPGFQNVFIQYMKDHFRIETNSEIISRMISEAAGWAGSLVANAAWSALKPFIPLLIFGIGAIYMFNKATSNQRK